MSEPLPFTYVYVLLACRNQVSLEAPHASDESTRQGYGSYSYADMMDRFSPCRWGRANTFKPTEIMTVLHACLHSLPRTVYIRTYVLPACTSQIDVLAY